MEIKCLLVDLLNLEQVREASAGRERWWRREWVRQRSRHERTTTLDLVVVRRSTGRQDPVHDDDDGQLVGHGLWRRSGQILGRNRPAIGVYRQRQWRHQRLRQDAHQHVRQERGNTLNTITTAPSPAAALIRITYSFDIYEFVPGGGGGNEEMFSSIVISTSILRNPHIWNRYIFIEEKLSNLFPVVFYLDRKQTQVSPSGGSGGTGDGSATAASATAEMKKEKTRCDTPDFMAELNGDSDETAADLANLERFISEDTSDGIINADTFKDLISEIHDLPPEFMEEFDFDTTAVDTKNVVANDFTSNAMDGSRTVDSIVSRLKQEEVEAADREIQAAMLDIGKSMSMNQSNTTTTSAIAATSSSISTNTSASITTSSCSTATLSTTSGSFNPIAASFDSSKTTTPTPSIQQQQQQQQRTTSDNMNRMPFGNTGPAELSPAALTLKQMAEQHQHKAQMGMTPAAMTPATGLSAPPTISNQGAPLVPPHHPPTAVNPMRIQPQQQQPQQQHQQQYNNNPSNAQQANNNQQFMNRPPYTGQGGYGPNSPMIKKEMPYFANSPLGGNSPGPGRPVQQQQQQQPGNNQHPHQVPGAKSSPVPMSQTSPMGPPTPQQIQQQQQQQFNARKAPTPTNVSGRTPPPTNASVQFSQTQQQQMHMTNNGQHIQVQQQQQQHQFSFQA